MSQAVATSSDLNAHQRQVRSNLLRRRLGWWGVRLSLGFICLLWTVPVIGLLVTSFRDEDSIRASGWWTALATSQDRLSSSISIDAPGMAEEEDGRFVVKGNLLDLAVEQGILDEGEAETVNLFGISRTQGANTEAGQTIEDERRNLTLSVDTAGNFELSSPEEFDNDLSVFLAVQLPIRFTFENYDTVINGTGIQGVDIGTAFINTIAVTIPATFIPIAIAAFAAYAFSWMDFPGRNLIFITVVALLVVPLQMALIPLQRVYGDVGLKDTYPGIWLAHSGFGLPLAIYLLRNYIGGLPREIIESAQIDGASHYQIFYRLVLPLSIPALASFAIFQFLWVWNDLLVARVFLGILPDNQVLTSQIKSMTGTYGNDWHLMTSAAFVSMFVPLIVFFSLQRYFVRGLLAGSVKGG